MGCGTSKGSASVLDEDAPENLKDAVSHNSNQAPLISDAADELTSVNSNNSSHESNKTKEPSTKSSSPLPPITSNGTDLKQPPQTETLVGKEEDTQQSEDDPPTLPNSAGGRAVAFEVASLEEQGGESLIKRHPPRKFQKLEDQQQGPNLTQEQLEEKQAIAEKRRQEILTQRVQSAKQRSARSAGRMRTRPTDADEVEQDDGIIESAANIPPENEL